MSDPKQFHIYGDLNVSAGLDASLGEGSVFISSQSSVLDVNGSTFLDQTTIDTTDGAFAVAGTNKIAFTPTNAAIELQGGASSYFNVTAGNLTLGSLLQDVIINTGDGFDVNANNSITLDSNANSYFNVSGGSNLTLGAASGRVIVNPGSAVSNALTLSATNAAGGVVISAGTAGVTVSSTDGPFLINAQNTASSINLVTDDVAQDLSINLLGSTNSSIVLNSSGTGSDAIKLFTSAGGVDLSSFGGITIDSQDVSNGIKIATVSSVPVVIGTANSTTTIAGDLVVSGTNTIINTQTLAVEDNVIAINSGVGELGADGGILIRRHQTANDDGSGDVVQDTGAGAIAGVFQAGSATPGTLVLAADSSSVDGFYNGFWIKFTVDAVVYTRRIKSYTGATQTATIYTAGETNGLDLSEAPSAAGAYTLYNSAYIATFYREVDDRWNIAYTSLAPRLIDESGTSMFSVQRYSAMDVGSVTIQANEVAADSLLNVNVINETTPDSGVTVEGVLIKDGLVNGSLPDATEVVSLLDNSTAAVDILNSGTAGSYMILVTAVQGGDLLSAQDNGAHATFVASSSGTGGGVARLSASLGSDGQRIDITWGTGQKIKLRHAPAFTGGSGASVMYRVKLISVV